MPTALPSIATHTIGSWDELQQFAAGEQKGNPRLYRGQQDATWDLKTSFEHLLERFNKAAPTTVPSVLEGQLIREFRRSYHQYDNNAPSDAERLEWVALMQHHGAPTRFLDFTYSLYVAAYFALEAATGECAVWAVNGSWLRSQSMLALRQAGATNIDFLEKLREKSHESECYDLMFSQPVALAVAPLNPFRLSQRLQIQKGLFLVPTDVSVSFISVQDKNHNPMNLL